MPPVNKARRPERASYPAANLVLASPSNYNSTKLCFVYFGFHRGNDPGKRNPCFILYSLLPAAASLNCSTLPWRGINEDLWRMSQMKPIMLTGECNAVHDDLRCSHKRHDNCQDKQRQSPRTETATKALKPVNIKEGKRD